MTEDVASLGHPGPETQDRLEVTREVHENQLASGLLEAPAASETAQEELDSRGQDLEFDLKTLFDSSLNETPPTLTEVEQVLQRVADGITVDESSLQYSENGTLLAGRVTIEGTELTGSLTMDGGAPRISIPVRMVEKGHFFMRAFDVSLNTKEGSVIGGTTVIQHHPNTLQDAPAPPAGNEPFVCGWSLSSDGSASTFTPTEAVFLGQSEGWSIGRLGNVDAEAHPGYSNLAAFDEIYARLAGHLSQ
ncbi:hypothetical protein [Planctomycetes bacterium Poly30]